MTTIPFLFLCLFAGISIGASILGFIGAWNARKGIVIRQQGVTIHLVIAISVLITALSLLEIILTS